MSNEKKTIKTSEKETNLGNAILWKNRKQQIIIKEFNDMFMLYRYEYDKEIDSWMNQGHFHFPYSLLETLINYLNSLKNKKRDNNGC